LKAVENNLVDIIWTNRTNGSAQHSPIYVHDLMFAGNAGNNFNVFYMLYFIKWRYTYITGKSWETKVKDVRSILKSEGIDGIVITALDEVAWLLNIRGSDFPPIPLVKSYVYLSIDRIILYVDLKKMNEDVTNHFYTNEATMKVEYKF